MSRQSFWTFLAGGVDAVLSVRDRGPVDLLGRWPGRRLAGRCEVRAGDVSAAALARVGMVLQEWW